MSKIKAKASALFVNSILGGGAGDIVAPTLIITMSDYALKSGDTATVTFTFSEAPINFTVADVTALNGSLSSFTVTGNPLIYTVTFTPTASVEDATNVITVGTSWTDAAGNAPVGSTTSDNYTVDTIAPSIVITAPVSGATAAAFTCTFTFSESVTGFVLGDITVANGTAGTFAGTGAVYTAVITPTAFGTVTVDVNSSVCVDTAGNANTAATQFSILYAAAVALWLDFSDLTTLYQTNDTSTPVTADAQAIGYIADKSGNARHATHATAGNRPAYKANIKNGKSVGRFDGTADYLATPTFDDNSGNNAITLFIVALFDVAVSAANRDSLYGCENAAGRLMFEGGEQGGTNRLSAAFSGTFLATSDDNSVVPTAFQLFMYRKSAPGGANHTIRVNTTARVLSPDGATDYSGTDSVKLIGARTSVPAQLFDGDMAEIMVFPSSLSDTDRGLVETYLNSKWSLF